MADIQEVIYQVGEAWQGAYNSATSYGAAAVVQDTDGLSIYRSLKDGNAGHALSDTEWWMKIIDFGTIKEVSDTVDALNGSVAAAETARQEAEAARVSNETARRTAETARISAEQTRADSETARRQNETTRSNAEALRAQAESERQSNESARQRDEIARRESETSRQNAEAQRQTAENNRASAEQARIDAENSRTQAEASRENRASTDHATAVSDHDTMDAYHTRADNDHTTATADHTTAASDHSTATADHTIAASDHTTAQADHTAATAATTAATNAADSANAAAANANDWQEKLESGDVVPALAENLESWAEDGGTPVDNIFEDTIRTTAGDDPVMSGEGGTLKAIVATSDFRCDTLLATAENQLRLKSSGGGAVAVGAGWYFPVPQLTYRAFGDAEENNGLILVASDGSNITTATVRFKALEDGVPTSVTDGVACPSRTVTYQGKEYKVYTTDGPGYLIVSGITYADTCARIAWEDWYDKFVSPTDAEDVGGSVNLAPLFAAAPNGTGRFLVCGRVQTEAVQLSETEWQITDPVARIAQPAWVTTEVEASGSTDGEGSSSSSSGETRYLHELTISGMASGGSALIEGQDTELSVNGTTLSYTDTSATAAEGAVRYELATPAVKTVTLDSRYTLCDVGVEMKEGAEGTADFTCEYSQNVADALSQIARYKVGEIQQHVETNIEDIAALKAKLEQTVAELEAQMAAANTVIEGYMRVSGSEDPALSYKHYALGDMGKSVFSILRPCLVGTKLTGGDDQVGTVLYELQKLGATTVNGRAIWLDVDGVAHAIDGSEGDVMVCNTQTYYRLMGKYTVEGVLYDVFIMSRSPFTWQGYEAEAIVPQGTSPDYTVSHKDTDGVVRMHSAYNPAWAGSYSAPSGITGRYDVTEDAEGNLVETFNASGSLLGGSGGLHSTDLALYTGEQYAMNQNPDTTQTVPFMNQTAASVENWYAMMLAEGGTFDAHNASLMGSGFCANDAATAAADWEESASAAKNGMRLYDKDGAAKMYSLASNIMSFHGDSSTFYAGQIVNSWRNPWHVMEAYRALCHAMRQGVGELEWFAFEGCKYKWRSIAGFAGPNEGEATAVVWKQVSGQMTSRFVDPTDKATSLEGNRIDLLFSTALFHGITTQVSPSWWVSGLIFAQDSDGNYHCYMERDQAKLIKSENGTKAAGSLFDFEQQYAEVLTLTKGEGYKKDFLPAALMLPASQATRGGGALHKYVGAYNWYTATAPSTAGQRSVRGFRRGNGASYSSLSPLTMGGYVAPSLANPSIGFGTCCVLVSKT